MELTTIEAGSGKVSVQIPGEWLRRSLLEGGDKLHALVEAVKEMERFDFKYVVYPELLKKREQERAKQVIQAPRVKICQHLFTTIGKKAREGGIVPYCMSCGEKKIT